MSMIIGLNGNVDIEVDKNKIKNLGQIAKNVIHKGLSTSIYSFCV